MQELKIVKRTGDLVDFDPERIRRAVAAALEATGTQLPEASVDRLDAAICDEVFERFVEFYPNVENVQDIVEKHLMREGLYEVAKAYILYRAERQQAREKLRRQAAENARLGRLTVQKRDGRLALFNIKRLEASIALACRDLRGEIDRDLLLRATIDRVYDGISTPRIEQALVAAAAGLIERHPCYSKLAARLLRQKLLREVLGRSVEPEGLDSVYREAFLRAMRKGLDRGRLDARMAELDLAKLVAELRPERDLDLDYAGLKLIYDTCLLREEGQPVELPQILWMRVAMGLALGEDSAQIDARAAEFYHLISRRRFLPAIPTIQHAGLSEAWLSAAYVAARGPGPAQVLDQLGAELQLARRSARLGGDWTAIPAAGAPLPDVRGESAGLVPLLKLASDASLTIGRGPWPREYSCASLEAWHLDFEDFLDLHRSEGDERRRLRDLPTVAWVPDLLMKRLMQDEAWTLMSPDEVPDLMHLSGPDFDRAYAAAEARALAGELRQHRRLPAKALWRKLLIQVHESGYPWVVFKEACDLRAPQGRAARVRGTTHGAEIVLAAAPDETVVCQQGSLNLAALLGEDGRLDEASLARTVQVAVRMLDNAIDASRQPDPAAERFSRRHRAIGLGMMGFQDLLYRMGIPFTSREALDTADAVTEMVSHAAILASSRLAAERGLYPRYEGSDWQRAVFPIDSLDRLERLRDWPVDVSRDARLDWAPVREAVARQGMRNATTMALAAGQRLAVIAGVFPAMEPVERNYRVEPGAGGEQAWLNPYLVEDLEAQGLWSVEILEAIKQAGGRVEVVSSIPERIKARHKEAGEIDPIWCLRLAAARGKWIDQSQATPIYLSDRSSILLGEIYASAWRMGLKTTWQLRRPQVGQEPGALASSGGAQDARLEHSESSLVSEGAPPTAEAGAKSRVDAPITSSATSVSS